MAIKRISMFALFLIYLLILSGCYSGSSYTPQDEIRWLEATLEEERELNEKLKKEINELEEELYIMAKDIDTLLDYCEYIANHFGYVTEAPSLVRSDYWFHIKFPR